MSAGDNLRGLLSRDRPLLVPGVYDGLTARQAELAGFEAIYAGGGALARTAGLPDIGLLQLGDLTKQVSSMLGVSKLPLVVDADTGFGGFTNLAMTSRTLARLGVAAFHIEDQTFPKRCGLKAGKEIIPLDEMCRKVRVAREEIADSGAILIARTDALSVEGLGAAVERAAAYAEAGAEMIFVVGLRDDRDVQAIGSEVACAKMIDLYTGMRPALLSQPEYFRLGYKLLVYPNELQRAAMRSAQIVLEQLKTAGHCNALADAMIGMQERDAIVRTDELLAIEDL